MNEDDSNATIPPTVASMPAAAAAATTTGGDVVATAAESASGYAGEQQSEAAMNAEAQSIVETALLHSTNMATATVDSAASSIPVVAATPAAATTSAATPIAAAPTTPEQQPPTTFLSIKKKKSVPTQRLLTTKKDIESAQQFVTKHVDVVAYLDERDAWFLGYEFWIFTVAQLRAALADDDFCTEAIDRYSSSSSTAKEDAADVMDVVDDTTDSIAASVALASTVAPASTVTTTPDALATTSTVAPASKSTIKVPIKVSLTVAEATTKLESWRNALQLQQPHRKHPTDTFRLDGAVQVLFSPAIRNFMHSIAVHTLYQFLSLRRTETGAVCELFRRWHRKACAPATTPTLPTHVTSAAYNQPPVTYPDSGVSRNLLTVTARMERAFTAIPPITSDREWLSDPISASTGAAKSFLIDTLGILSATVFASMRTKDMSLALEKWRAERGDPVLRGSGKVAMISSWKAAIREVADVEADPGKIIDMRDDLDDPNILIHFGNGKKNAAAPAHIKFVDPNALELFLSPDDTDLLKQADIATISDFLSATSESYTKLFHILIQHEKVKDFEAFNALIVLWRDAAATKQAAATVTLKEQQEQLRLHKEVDAATSERRKVAGTKRKRASPVVAKKKTVPDAVPSTDDDAIFAVSSSARRFLAVSMDIRTALDFLSQRSSDIAEAFVRWRVQEGMPVLKGMGSIASVSGWKSLVRKRALEIGQTDLPDLDRTANFHKRGDGKPVKKESSSSSKAPRKKKVKTEAADGMDDAFLATSKRMPAKSRHKFPTDGKQMFALLHADRKGEYVFEVTTRAKSIVDTPRIYLAYKGYGTPPDVVRKAIFQEVMYDQTTDGSNAATAFESKRSSGWILPDVEVMPKSHPRSRNMDTSRPFCFDLSGCGLIDVGLYGVRPYVRQDLTLLKTAVTQFTAKDEEMVWHEAAASNTSNIAIVRKTYDSAQYLVAITKPIQKGQVISLCFPKISDALSVTHPNNEAKELSCLRAIDEAFHTLAVENIHDMLTWVKGQMTAPHADESLQAKITRLYRLHWCRRRLMILFGMKADAKTNGDDVAFDVSSYLANAEQKPDCLKVLQNEFMMEMGYAYEIDSLCGGGEENITHWFVNGGIWVRDVLQILYGSYSELLSSSSTFETSVGTFAVIFKKYADAALAKSEALKFNLHDGFVIKNGVQLEGIATPKEFEGSANVVAIDVSSEDKKAQLVPKSAIGVQFKLCIAWYEGILRQLCLSLLSYACSIVDFKQSVRKPESLVMKVLDDIFKEKFNSESVTLPSPKYKKIAHLPAPMSIKSDTFPNSYTFFLGIVWPRLSEAGWTLAGNHKYKDLVFYPPTKGASRLDKKRIDEYQKRRRTSKEISRLGLSSSDTPKLLKRFLIESPDSARGKSSCLSSDEVMSLYDTHLTNSLKSDDSKQKLRICVNSLKRCFEVIAPSLSKSQSLDDDDTFAFLKFLIALPSIISGSGLTEKESIDLLMISKEILSFIENNFLKIFNGSKPWSKSLPPIEQYVQSDVDSHVTNKLEPTVDPSDNLAELIRDEDKPMLTDFIITVIEQAVPIRATSQDVIRKNYRINEGHPGIACRHCLGNEGTGKYFFGSIESISTAYTIIESHVMKCGPQDIKDKVAASRALHIEQRKKLVKGSQQAYFNGLWKRLQTSRIVNPYQSRFSSIFNSSTLRSWVNKTADQIDDEDNVVFQDHIEAMDYARFMNNDRDRNHHVQDAIDRYYACLDYAGRVYETKRMPPHFSSEWLLAKVLPKHKHHTPYRNVG